MFPTTITFNNQAELKQFAQLIAKEIKADEPEHPHITFKEAREELGISDDTLTRRLKNAHIKSYRGHGGKYFDRKHLYKIR